MKKFNRPKYYTWDLPSAGAQAFDSPHYSTSAEAFDGAAEILHDYFGWPKTMLRQHFLLSDPGHEQRISARDSDLQLGKIIAHY